MSKIFASLHKKGLGGVPRLSGETAQISGETAQLSGEA
jgi:hypothetical protein